MGKSKGKKSSMGKKIGLGLTESVIHIVVYILVIFIFIRVATLAYDFSYQVFGNPFMSRYNEEIVQVDIPEGSTVSDVSRTLADHDLIKYSLAFSLRMRLAKLSDSIQPGSYEMSRTMTADEIMSMITTPQTTVTNAGEEEGSAQESDAPQDTAATEETN